MVKKSWFLGTKFLTAEKTEIETNNFQNMASVVLPNTKSVFFKSGRFFSMRSSFITWNWRSTCTEAKYVAGINEDLMLVFLSPKNLIVTIVTVHSLDTQHCRQMNALSWELRYRIFDLQRISWGSLRRYLPDVIEQFYCSIKYCTKNNKIIINNNIKYLYFQRNI